MATPEKTDNRKAELLSTPVEHIDIASFDARPIIDAWGKMSFTSRDAARAAEILNMALEDSELLDLADHGGLHRRRAAACTSSATWSSTTWPTPSSPPAPRSSTWISSKRWASSTTRPRKSRTTTRCARSTSTASTTPISTRKSCSTATTRSTRSANQLEPRPYTSREFIYEIGKWLAAGNAKKPDSLIQRAYEKGVPIFVPAFIDCSAGFGIVKHQVERRKAKKPYVTIDSAGDFRELTDIKLAAGTTALFMVGGGVPKNFAQDTVVCAEILGHDDVEVHKYAVQITVADVRDGACSSSTLQEAASWGKVSTVHEQMVFAEATSVAPIIVSDAYHRGAWKKREARNWAKLFE